MEQGLLECPEVKDVGINHIVRDALVAESVEVCSELNIAAGDALESTRTFLSQGAKVQHEAAQHEDQGTEYDQQNRCILGLSQLGLPVLAEQADIVAWDRRPSQ
jgi:hypothetical protein